MAGADIYLFHCPIGPDRRVSPCEESHRGVGEAMTPASRGRRPFNLPLTGRAMAIGSWRRLIDFSTAFNCNLLAHCGPGFLLLAPRSNAAAEL